MNALAKKKRRKINTLLYIEVREEDGKYIYKYNKYMQCHIRTKKQNEQKKI